MNEKLLEIYNKCRQHNIIISTRYFLSDVLIEVVGVMFVYDSKNKEYKPLCCKKWVSIHEMKDVDNIDLVVLAIDEIFNALNNRKDELRK